MLRLTDIQINTSYIDMCLSLKVYMEFPGVIKKKSCGVSRGLGFRP